MAIGNETLAIEDRPQNFHFFARLPIELRAEIWTYNLPGPRIIEIKCSKNRNKSTAYRSSSPVPANLHVCNESRSEALKRYRLLFGVCSGPPRILIDPSRDMLYFNRRKTLFNKFISAVPRKDLACVRHIAINEKLLSYRGPRQADQIRAEGAHMVVEKILCQIYQLLPGLKTLSFVSGDANPVYSPDAVFVEPQLPNRMLERRVKEAINTVENQPRFRPITWNIQDIAAGPECSTHDQTILGYEGSRAAFWKEFMLPEYQKDMMADVRDSRHGCGSSILV
ncbi:hypothetical protein F5Y04DRAFT_287670 [Hypomontagnella monticulosa]|nr:hypothetical protein F5Y04DRAFT_287670 [Hypomontagnella monticulosa]